MILRNKILIGVASTTAVVGVSTGIAIQSMHSGSQALVFHNSFITSINAANEFMQLNVKEKQKDGTYKEGVQTGFGLPMTSFNSKTKNLSINFDQIFTAQDRYKILPGDSKQEKLRKEKLRLFYIGKGVGVTGVYIRYNESGVVSRMNSYNVDIPTEYATDKINAFDYSKPDPAQSTLDAASDYKPQLKKMLGIQDGYMVSTFQDRDTLYDIDGIVRYHIPSLNSDGTSAKKYNLSNDNDHPVLIDPVDGTIKSLDQVSVTDIKDAITTQLIKLAYFADKEMQTISFSSASYIDDIKDSTIESFQLDPTNDQKGIFTSVRGKSLELLKMLLKLDTFKGSKKIITPLSQAKYDNLTEADKQYFHMYDSDGKPFGLNINLLGDDPFATKPKGDTEHIGIMVKKQMVETPNILVADGKRFSDFAIKVEKQFSTKFKNSINNHLKDEDLFIRRKEYAPKTKMFNWYQSNKAKTLPSDGESMYNYLNHLDAAHKYVNYTNYGFTSAANDGLRTPMKGQSVGEIFNLFWKHNANPSKSPVDLLSKIDRDSLFEKDSDAVDGYAPHPQVSIKHPLVMGINDIELTQFDFMKNYRTSINTEAQKIYTKDEVKKSIFGSNSATDTDMYEFLYLSAALFENDFITPSNTKLSVDGRYTIGTGMSDDDLKTFIAPLNLPKGSYTIDNGFIIFKGYGTGGSKIIGKTHAIEKVYDKLFRTNKWKVNDLGIQGLKNSKNQSGKDVVITAGQPTYKTSTLTNSLLTQQSILDDAKSKADALLVSDQFRSQFVAQTKTKASLQTFAKASRDRQDILNSMFKDVFLSNGIDFNTFAESERGKHISETPIDPSDPTGAMKDDMLKDYYLASLDARGSVLNIAYEESQIKGTMSNGLPLSFDVFSNLVLSMSEQVKGSGSLFLFDKFEDMIEQPGTFAGKIFMSGSPDDQFTQFAAFMYMLDKLNVQLKIEVSGSDDADEDMFNTMFGKDNISQYDKYEKTQSSTSVHIVELKAGKYKEAFETYIDYVYSGGIATAQKDGLNTWAKAIDKAYAKAIA